MNVIVFPRRWFGIYHQGDMCPGCYIRRRGLLRAVTDANGNITNLVCDTCGTRYKANAWGQNLVRQREYCLWDRSFMNPLEQPAGCRECGSMLEQGVTEKDARCPDRKIEKYLYCPACNRIRWRFR